MCPDQPQYKGLTLPLWTLSLNQDYGSGDLAALRQLLPWLADTGIDYIHLLPVLERASPHDPYAQLCTMAYDPLYLDIGCLPDLTSEERSYYAPKTPHLDYLDVLKRKSNLFQLAFSRFYTNDLNNSDFQSFQEQEKDWLTAYSIYKFLSTQEHGTPSWKKWNTAYNTSHKAYEWVEQKIRGGNEKFYLGMTYHAWVQWHLHTQWSDLDHLARKSKLRLMTTFPNQIQLNSIEGFYDSERTVAVTQCESKPLSDTYPTHWWQRRLQKLTSTFSLLELNTPSNWSPELCHAIDSYSSQCEYILGDLSSTSSPTPLKAPLSSWIIYHWQKLDPYSLTHPSPPYHSVASFTHARLPPLPALWKELILQYHSPEHTEQQLAERQLYTLLQLIHKQHLLPELRKTPFQPFNATLLEQLLTALLSLRTRHLSLSITDLLLDPAPYYSPSQLNTQNWSYRISPTVEAFSENPTLKNLPSQLKQKLKPPPESP